MGLVTYSTDVATYVPGRDPRKCKQISVLDGANFIIDYEGPRAAYENIYWHTSGFSKLMRQHVTELRCNDQLFFGTSDGIYYRDETSHILYRLFDVTLENVHWPWSVAYVGRKYYFAQYEIGLWEYDPANGDIRHVKTPVYDRTRWVCACNGRLVYLTSTEVSWSGQDDGSSLTPSLATGAGSQLTSLLGGVPYRVDPVVDGVVVATSQGLIKGTMVDETYVFAWRVVSRELRLMSPSCAVVVPDAGIIYADEHGLRYLADTATGESTVSLQKWEEEVSDAFRNDFLKTPRVKTPGNMLMHYSYAESTIFVALSTGGPVGFFTKAYAYFVPSGKWGVLSANFTGLFDLPDENGQFRGGFLDASGECRRFADLHWSEQVVNSAMLMPYHYFKVSDGTLTKVSMDTRNDLLQDPVTGKLELHLEQDVAYHAKDELWYSDYDQSIFSKGVTSGLYKKSKSFWSDTVEYQGHDELMLVSEPLVLSGDDNSREPDAVSDILDGVTASADDAIDAALWGEGDVSTHYGVRDELCFSPVGFSYMRVDKYRLPIVGLNTHITIGPIRYVTQENAAELNMISGIFLGTASFGTYASYEDWNSSSLQAEDYNNSSEADEDWGIGVPTTYSFKAKLDITRDSHPDTASMTEDLYACNQTEFSVTYRPRGTSSVFNLLELSAKDVGNFFYIKSMEIEGQTIGALY